MKSILVALSLLVGTSAMANHLSLELGDSAYLPECGGMIKTNNGGNGNQLNIVLSGVELCSNFDIIGEDGYVVKDYKSKKIPGPNGDRSGSFTIPSKMNDARWYGKRNSVKVVIKSNSGKHQDHVTIYYTVYGY